MKSIFWLVVAFTAVVTTNAGLPESKYKYYFTWRGYKADDSGENAIYIWRGNKVGKGRKGFLKVLEYLNEIPNKSTVYVFPMAAKFRSEGRLFGPEDSYPFFQFWNNLRDVELRKKLNLIFTNVDQNGKTLDAL
jgi:hypothetical protein